MYCRNWSNEELGKFPYPNLMAEIMESGYSICTVSDHMGLGIAKENDPVVWAKLKGEEDIYANELVGMANLFEVSIDYLFSKTLDTFCGESKAKIRWHDWNKRQEQEHKRNQEIKEITEQLESNPELLAFMKLAATCTRDQITAATECIRGEA